MLHGNVCHAPEMHYKLFFCNSVHYAFFFYSKGSHYSPTCHRVQANLEDLGNLEKGKPGKQWNLVKNDIPEKKREHFLKEFLYHTSFSKKLIYKKL